MGAKYSLPLFDWLKLSHHLVSGESTLHEVTLFEARSRIFLPTAQSCAALFCCRLPIRASSLGWLVGNDIFQVIYVLKMIYQVGKKQCLNSGRKRNDIGPLESDFIIQPPSLWNFLGLRPHPSGISNSLRGGSLDIFWNHTIVASNSRRALKKM